ncbi:putative bifunctional diguanylate cyclase/phosphodiesterase [Roseibium salinum]|uniref:EAL domain-containing protein n=1 Tax=Roseibium salinum TaxID=1604349 RepID=A0ABT3QY59_9HYPH|nr:EAL domain-containing protein [Roseibium sp. DSM 29163]MCX2721866.1 EAL domain-containing protein [Roseibium sp. DSM 29163]
MATFPVRSNIAIFLISMSLMLTLALGIYASNRLLTYWLLVRGLEHSFLPQEQAVAEILAATNERPATPASVAGLRLSSPDDAVHDLAAIKALKRLFQDESTGTIALDAALLLPAAPNAGAPSSANSLPASWTGEKRFLSTDTLNRTRAVLGSTGLAVVPEVTWHGKFGPNAVIAYRPADAGPATPQLLLLVDQSTLLSELGPLIWTISAAVGVLCLASFAIAAIILWLGYYDKVRTNRDIHYLAHHDALTGLPNRAVFNARLTEALRLAQAKASNLGVMLIDVDKFKEINDTHGHGIGDVFLQIVSERLKAVFDNHLVARLSGDEFAVLITTMSDPARMTRLAADMIAATGAPCLIDGREIKLSLSIGIARATDGSWRSSRLLHCADLALYRAKHSGRSTFSWYTPELDSDAQKRKEVEAGLIKALKYDQFRLLYQPQYSLRDGELKGYEALIRWDHPEKGTIKPDVFIPVAEDTGLIQEIGTWVLNRACREAAMWQDQNRRIAVNVSPAQFIAGETHKRVAQALRNSRLDPGRLEIEITESLLISNTEAVIETLREIRDMGVSIAMDDFGTGYSSLSYLSLFPFDKIKIDKSFVQNLGKATSTDAIVTSIIGLGRSLDVTITAEGVETEEQAILLRAAGCDLVQGFMFGRPDSVEKHEASSPVFPFDGTGRSRILRPQSPDAYPKKITLSPELARSARAIGAPAPSSDELADIQDEEQATVPYSQYPSTG